MPLSDLLWLCTSAYALHVLEEYQFDWRNWARAVIKLPVEWTDFYIVNALVIVLGIVAANLLRQPALALAFPALMLINATFFHVLPSWRRKRGRPVRSTAIEVWKWCPGSASWSESVSMP